MEFFRFLLAIIRKKVKRKARPHCPGNGFRLASLSECAKGNPGKTPASPRSRKATGGDGDRFFRRFVVAGSDGKTLIAGGKALSRARGHYLQNDPILPLTFRTLIPIYF